MKRSPKLSHGNLQPFCINQLYQAIDLYNLAIMSKTQPQLQPNLTQPNLNLNCSWVWHENDFANPTNHPQKLSSNHQEPQVKIHWPPLNIMGLATTSRAIIPILTLTTTTTKSTTTITSWGWPRPSSAQTGTGLYFNYYCITLMVANCYQPLHISLIIDHPLPPQHPYHTSLPQVTQNYPPSCLLTIYFAELLVSRYITTIPSGWG